MKRKSRSVQNLPLRALSIEKLAQRQRINQTKLRKFIKEFDLRKFGILTVSIREGVPYIVDGQHRWRAAMARGMGDTQVKCDVYRNLTLEEEADLFLSLNDTTRVPALDKYLVGITKGDPECVGVDAVVRNHQLKVGPVSNTSTLACPSALRIIYRRDDGETLNEVLGTLKDAWGGKEDVFEGAVVRAVGEVVGTHNGELDRKRLVKRLKKYPGGPTGLIGNARGLARIKPGLSVSGAAKESILHHYNRGLRSGAINY